MLGEVYSERVANQLADRMNEAERDGNVKLQTAYATEFLAYLEITEQIPETSRFG